METAVLEPRNVRFVETPPPTFPAGAEREWRQMRRRNPHLFDGPVVLCTDFRVDRMGTAHLTWARATYRYRAVRGPSVAAVFVGVVQPSIEGDVLVGGTSSWTSSPGRTQLPGGSMEPPPDGAPLSLDLLRIHAVRELREEVGVDLVPSALEPLCLAQMPNGNVGFFFEARPRSEQHLRESFADLCTAERALGREPEFDAISFVDDDRQLPRNVANHVAPVIRHYFATMR